MHIEDIRSHCLEKHQLVTEELPFGPDTLVFKIAGKVFLLIGLDQVENLSFNVKCDPEYAIELREKYDQTIFPGYHMNKIHWNTVFLGRELNPKQLLDLIDHSFDLVVKSLPKSMRETI